jgi:hypothetical protein
MCSITAHNETENYPAPPKVWRSPPKKIKKKTTKKWDDWHALVSALRIDTR